MHNSSLRDDTVREIALRCGRGWFYADKPKAAPCLEWQLARLANYNRVMELAPRYVRSMDGITDSIRSAIWIHVCVETDLRWKAEA